MSFSDFVLKLIASWMQDGCHGSLTPEHAREGRKETIGLSHCAALLLWGEIFPETTTDFPPRLIERKGRTEGLGVWDHTHALH